MHGRVHGRSGCVCQVLEALRTAACRLCCHSGTPAELVDHATVCQESDARCVMIQIDVDTGFGFRDSSHAQTSDQDHARTHAGAGQTDSAKVM